MTDYVLVAQHYPSVQHYARQPKGNWLYSATTELSANVFLNSLGFELPLAEIYDRIEFPDLSEDNVFL